MACRLWNFDPLVKCCNHHSLECLPSFTTPFWTTTLDEMKNIRKTPKAAVLPIGMHRAHQIFGQNWVRLLIEKAASILGAYSSLPRVVLSTCLRYFKLFQVVCINNETRDAALRPPRKLMCFLRVCVSLHVQLQIGTRKRQSGGGNRILRLSGQQVVGLVGAKERQFGTHLTKW